MSIVAIAIMKQSAEWCLANSIAFSGARINSPGYVGKWPNITGSFNKIAEYQAGIPTVIGALYEVEGFDKVYGGNGYWRSGVLGFSANRSKSIYRNSETVQPSAAQTLIIIRVWVAGGWTVSIEYIEHDLPAENEYSGRVFVKL